MRELKFRGWNVSRNEFVFISLPKGDISWEETEFEWRKDDISSDWEQLTGLKDRDGVDIYEGDIVEFTSFENGYERRVVTYLAPSFYLQKRIGDTVDVDLFSTLVVHETVIGNVHQNPDLLTSLAKTE